MDTATEMSTRGRRRLLVNRSFALLWWGQAISNIGDTVLSAALVLWVGGTLAHGFAWVALAVGGVLAAQYVPQVIVAPVAGVFVDRWDRRATMLRMDAFRALLIGGLTALALLRGVPDGARLLAVYVAVLAESVAAQFFNPSRLALIGTVVPDRAYDQAMGLSQAAFGLSVLIGPAIAAPLVVGVGAAWALLIDALSFAFSFVMLLQVRSRDGDASFVAEHADPQTADPPAAGIRGVVADLRAGMALLARSRILHALAAGTVLANVGLGAVITLAYFFVTQNLHADPRFFGFISTTFGLGAIVGALLTVLWARRVGEERVLVLGLLAMGVTMATLGRMSNLFTALAVACCFGAALAAVQVVIGPLILRGAPADFVGRVSSALTPLGSLATLLGIGVSGGLVAGPLQGWHATVLGLSVGPVDACFTLAGVVVFIGGLYAGTILESAPPSAGHAPAAETRAREG